MEVVITLVGECVISSVLSHHSKSLKRQTSVIALLWLRVYSASKVKYTLKACRRANPKEEASIHPGFFLLYLCLLPYLEPALCKLGYLFHLRFSLWSLDFLLLHFCGLFSFFVF